MSTTRSRRVFALAFACAVLASSLAETASAAEPPNIIVVMLDDADKASVDALPNIKSLIADQGMTFERFYTPEASCCPSRASFLLGEHPHRHGVIRNDGRYGGFERFERLGHENRVIAKYLRGAGYRTGLMGKYLNGYGERSSSARHVPRYWDRWFSSFSKNYYDYDMNSDGRVVHFGRSKKKYQTFVLDRVSRRFIERSDAPVFAFIPMRAPHSKLVEPPGHHSEFAGQSSPSLLSPSYDEADMSDKPAFMRRARRISGKAEDHINGRWRKRMRMMLAVDDHVGNLVDDLTASGELANTYIFVTSDNGWMQGEHRLARRKGLPYEESSHLPLYVRGPGIVPGSTSDELVSMIDLFGTFNELAGGAELQRDGRSLVGLLNGTATDWREQLLLEKPGTNKKELSYAGIVTEQYKFVRYSTGERELYDLVADPYELQSLHASAPPALLADLGAKLDALRKCKGAECRVADGGP